MLTVIVTYRLPVPIPRDVMLEEFADAAAKFGEVPGLIRKYFNYDEASHTGHSVYLWEDAERAQAFFGPNFTKTMHEKFDATPELAWFDTLLVVDNEQAKVFSAEA